MPTPNSPELITELKAQLDAVLSRTQKALDLLARSKGDEVLSIGYAITAVLQGRLPHSDVPHPLTVANIRQRLADHLADTWPRMVHDGFRDDVAAAAMEVFTPIVEQLQETEFAQRLRVVEALTQRDQARAVAVALYQIDAEAERLLVAGDVSSALAVLRSDGQLIPQSDQINPNPTRDLGEEEC